MEWPDLGANRSISNKIRIDETYLAGQNQLRRDSSAVRSAIDNYPPESPRLGVYLSPTNEVNQDIAEQFGGVSIDDFIGDPSALSLDHYPDLKGLEYEYLKKFTTGRRRPQNYIRLLRHYDSALFQLIKKFVPYRANTQVGLVIEPHMLTRSKLPIKHPTIEDLQYSSSINLAPGEAVWFPGGFVQDGDGEPFRDGPGYVEAGVIETPHTEVEGENQQTIQSGLGIEMYPSIPSQSYDMVVIDGTSINASATFLQSYANEFNEIGLDDNPSTSGSMAGQLDLGVSGYGRDIRVEGSQYVFYSYYQSGSDWLQYTSSRYDYHEALNPTILDSSRSEISNVGLSLYDSNVYYNRAFTETNPYGTQDTFYLSSSIGLDNTSWTSVYGLQPVSAYTGSTQLATLNTSSYWILSNTLGLVQASVQGTYTSSIRIPAFFYEANDPTTTDLLYEVTIDAYRGSSITTTLELHYGDLDCGLTGSISVGATRTSYTFVTKALGNWLGLRVYTIANATSVPFNESINIPSLKVKCLNYRAQVQDFHLHDSYGMRNARYDGCKMSSADWNVPSTDTVDNGPVVEVTIGGGLQVNVAPNSTGNLQVL